eukprot:gnl/MRDRNA2_/MRDRNA2_89074_c0_seq1.p1 gnl/MRDRNA2_/MRDRNA2_89074_c0~~gnl/MRDRNA2_/MRDRNA2_89074_c0_seq1.p1  ORF type:complete len:741 (+),score=165.38 gnl/MRDRNA2_/MRDRNA2_89074_c0_seq1:91-2223(+)
MPSQSSTSRNKIAWKDGNMVIETLPDNQALPTLLQPTGNAAERQAISDVLKGLSDLPTTPKIPRANTLERSQKTVGTHPKSDKASKNEKNQRKADSASDLAEAKSSAWKSVGRMVGHLGIFRKDSEKTSSLLQQEARVSDDELLELAKLESLLLNDYETAKHAFQVVTADKACFTEIDLRYAVSQRNTKADLLNSTLGKDDIQLGDVPQLFISLCKLLKYEQGPIPKAIFLMFPERLRFERLQRARFARTGVIRAGEAPLDPARLLQSLHKGAKTREAAKKLLNQVGAALQLQPQDTAQALLKKNKAYGGPNSGIRFVVNLIRQHGAPFSGDGLDILISGWAICSALATSAVTLGTLTSSGSMRGGNSEHRRKGRMMLKAAGALGAFGGSSLQRLRRLRNRAHHAEDDAPDKLGIATKVAFFGARLMRNLSKGKRRRHYQHKVGISSTSESDCEENHVHLWQILPAGEILHCLRMGAKALDGEDFKQLLQAAWSLFDKCDAVTWMIEPKAASDSRAVQLLAVQEALCKIVSVDFHSSHHSDHAELLHQQLLQSQAVTKQLKKFCEEADDGLLRRAALYGLPILLERVSTWIHASVERIRNPTIAGPSRTAAHDMDSAVAEVLRSLTPYEVAVEEGLGYQPPNHSCDTCFTSRETSSSGAAVDTEEAWSRFLRSRESSRRLQQDSKTKEAGEHAFASSERFCTHKLLRPGF